MKCLLLLIPWEWILWIMHRMLARLGALAPKSRSTGQTIEYCLISHQRRKIRELQSGTGFLHSLILTDSWLMVFLVNASTSSNAMAGQWEMQAPYAPTKLSSLMHIIVKKKIEWINLMLLLSFVPLEMILSPTYPLFQCTLSMLIPINVWNNYSDASDSPQAPSPIQYLSV